MTALAVQPAKERLGIDVDEVVARLHEPWIRWCNRVFGSKLDPAAGFPTWDFPVELFGKDVYDFLHPLIYDCDVVQPYFAAKTVVDILRASGHPVAWVTSCVNRTDVAKLRWLKSHGFFQPGDLWVPGSDKSKAPVDVLIDDGLHNVESFPGRSILVRRPHNEMGKWSGEQISELAELPSIL